jgi:5-methylcytosine-specific restriction endonuclease McrA
MNRDEIIFKQRGITLGMLIDVCSNEAHTSFSSILSRLGLSNGGRYIKKLENIIDTYNIKNHIKKLNKKEINTELIPYEYDNELVFKQKGITVRDIRRACITCNTLELLCNELGICNAGSSSKKLRHAIALHNIETNINFSHVNIDISIPLLNEAVFNSDNLQEVCEYLSLSIQHDSYLIETLIKRNNISTSHFDIPITNVEELFTSDYNIESIDARRKLIHYKIKDKVCSNCGIDSWNNETKGLFDLHHIDDNHDNNSVENLQILCSMCHSQTDSYSSTNFESIETLMDIIDNCKTKTSIMRYKSISQYSLYRIKYLFDYYDLQHNVSFKTNYPSNPASKAFYQHYKNYMLCNDIWEYKCQCCGISEYNNKPIILEIDHINGFREDNRPENLRLLCKNCHSIQDTSHGKNFKAKHRYEIASGSKPYFPDYVTNTIQPIGL